MIQVKLDGLEELRSGLDDLIKDKFPSILARTLTLAAQDAKAVATSLLQREIDKPTPWTLKSLFVWPAEKSEAAMPGGIMAGLAFKHEMGAMPRSALRRGVISAPRSMRAQTYGGTRQLKESEKTLRSAGLLPEGTFLVPAIGAQRDSYGNVPGSFMNKVLYGGVSRGSASQGYAAPMSGEKYFILYLQPSARIGPIGIFKRMEKDEFPLRVFTFSRTANYKIRYPFESIASAAARASLQKRWDESVAAVYSKYLK